MPTYNNITYIPVHDEEGVVLYKYNFYYLGRIIGYAYLEEYHSRWVYLSLRPPNDYGYFEAVFLLDIAGILDILNGVVRLGAAQVTIQNCDDDNNKYEF